MRETMQSHDMLEEWRDREGLALRLDLGRELPQVLHDLRGTVDLADREIDELGVLRLVEHVAQQPQTGARAHERVVDLMRDRGGDGAERRHLLGLEQLGAERLLVREVADDRHRTRRGGMLEERQTHAADEDRLVREQEADLLPRRLLGRQGERDHVAQRGAIHGMRAFDERLSGHAARDPEEATPGRIDGHDRAARVEAHDRQRRILPDVLIALRGLVIVMRMGHRGAGASPRWMDSQRGGTPGRGGSLSAGLRRIAHRPHAIDSESRLRMAMRARTPRMRQYGPHQRQAVRSGRRNRPATGPLPSRAAPSAQELHPP